MTDIKVQLIEKVQATLAKPPATKPAGSVAKSLRRLSSLGTQLVQQDAECPAEVVETIQQMNELAKAKFIRLSPDDFTSMVLRLNDALSGVTPVEPEVAVEPIAESPKVEAVEPVAATPVKSEPAPAAVSSGAGSLEDLTNELADDPELVQEFLVEAREHLGNVESGLLIIEKDPSHIETLHAVFRSFHTIKGLAAFLGAHTVQKLAHETESVLDLLRSGALTPNSEITDLILQSADSLTRMLNQVGALKLSELPAADPALLAHLTRYSKPGQQPEPSEPVKQSAPAVEAKAPVAAPVEAEAPVTATKTIPLASVPELASAAQSNTKQAESGVVRVDTSKLEYLIDMVGELVIAESVVRNDPTVARAEDPALSRNLAQLSRVVEEVQKTSMAMRMMPVGALFRKMTRLVRDLSRKSGKQVDLVTIGEEVELDRTIVEELADPMVHMIRNAVDHGLETVEERRAAGKSDTGTVTLKALHDAGDIVIEISDDGKGLDKDRILAKARRVGLVGEDQVIDEADIFKLIFEPGFSTAAKVTDLSGRGVGMDVVKRHIQKLRGRIDIKSVLGQGCTFILRLPLTLAIIDGLVVSVGSQRYILPLFAVREMFSPAENSFITVENRAEAALFRDRLLPVVRLSRLFSIEDASPNPGILIVAESRNQPFCIAVDHLVGKQEVVIKNLGKTFRDVPAVAGGAILGDGRVGLILDLNALR